MNLAVHTANVMQLCVGCTLEFEPQDTLGATEDPAGVGMFAEVVRVGEHGYLVSSDVLGGVVIVYDSEGRYQRELTRQGEGPGELRSPPRFARGNAGVLFREWRSPTLTLFSDDLDFRRTFRIPHGSVGSMRADPVTGGWLLSYTAPGGDWSEAGVLLLDEGGDVVRSMQPQTGSPSLNYFTGDVVRDPEGRIWIASLVGMVDVFDENLRLLGSLALELPGMETTWEPDAPGDSPAAMVMDMRLAPDGSGVWVYAFAPVVDFRFMETLPPLEELFDTFVYWIRFDSNGLRLVGTDRLDTLVRPLDGDTAFDLVDTPDGDRRVRVGRLHFTESRESSATHRGSFPGQSGPVW